MTIRVLLFAILRDAAGRGEVSVELPVGATAGDAGAALGSRYPMLQPYLGRIAYAVNRSYVSAGTELHEGDEVAFIPPVSGG